MRSLEFSQVEGNGNTAIVGICKNAGKTTLLNYILASNRDRQYGVFSTGRDGEDTDTLFHTPKPRVELGANQLFCCDTDTLDSHGSAVAILEKLFWGSSTRALWLAKTCLPIQTEITGPATVRDQIRTLHRLKELGAEQILIDGSLDRKSIALSDAVDSVVVVVGASFGSISSITAELRRLCLLNQLPPTEQVSPDAPEYALLRDSECLMIRHKGAWLPTGTSSLLDTEWDSDAIEEMMPDLIYIPGAITDEILAKRKEQLLGLGIPLLLRHPDCLKLSYPKLEQFAQTFHADVLIPFKIRGFVLNSFSVGASSHDADDFRARLRREFPQLELPDIRELSL